MSEETDIAAAKTGDEEALGRLFHTHERLLRAHCYRMSGSLSDAEDLMQETKLRVWRGLASFEGRSSLRTWLLRIATNVCLDKLARMRGRTLPLELGPPVDSVDGRPDPEVAWLEPCPVDIYEETRSPEARTRAREHVALAFLVALQLLPPRQRAVLLLRDVIGLEASEVATLLEITVAAANSALQRARETMAERNEHQLPLPTEPLDHARSSLLARYVAAWESSDHTALLAVLHEDATLAMPPMSDWLLGAKDIARSIGQMIFQRAPRGSILMRPIEANGAPAFAAYTRDADSGDFVATAIHVLEVRGERIAGICAFLSPGVFPHFHLPATMEAASVTHRR